MKVTSVLAVAMLLGGACVIPDVDIAGRACPCADGYVCDEDTQRCFRPDELPDESITPLDMSEVDLTPPPDLLSPDLGNVVMLGGEEIHLPDGWTAKIYLDFSAPITPYVYKADDFDDPVNMDSYDNAPNRIITLVPPFTDGIAILTGRAILEVPTVGTPALHAYTPSAPNAGDFPDHPADLFYAPAAGALPARILVSGVSTGNGDGVFQVDTAFAMTLLLASNNNSCVAFDPNGLFNAQTGPQTYYCVISGNQGHITRLADTKPIVANSSPTAQDVEILSATEMAVVIDESGTTSSASGVADVTISANGTFPMQILAGATATRVTLVTGAITRMGTKIHAVFAPGRLMELGPNDDPVELATTLSPGWTWVAAVVPPDTHSAGAAPVYLVLESNRALGIDRVIELLPP